MLSIIWFVVLSSKKKNELHSKIRDTNAILVTPQKTSEKK